MEQMERSAVVYVVRVGGLWYGSDWDNWENWEIQGVIVIEQKLQLKRIFWV